MNAPQLKSLFLKTLIVCLVGSAAVAVTAILVGGMNDITTKSLLTIVIVGIHALAGLAFINMNEAKDEVGTLRTFANVVFGIIVLSFVTATLGIWDVMQSDLVWKLYMAYFVTLVAVLHAEVLGRILDHQRSTNYIVFTNYVFMALVATLLFVVIFTANNELLGEMFFRILGALAVVDGTLTLTAVILDKLYLSKHPELITPGTMGTERKKGPSVLVVIVLAFLALQFIGPFLFFFLR